MVKSIETISVLEVPGPGRTTIHASEAIAFLTKSKNKRIKRLPEKYEIIIKYNTGEKIEASFRDREDCILFLRTYK